MDIQAELISIGNELLSGRTLNTHAQDLGGALSAIGLQLVRDTTIPDDIATIQSAAKEALDRTALIFISGGLGPTIDDITRDAVAGLLKQEIILDRPSVDAIAKRFELRGYPMTPAAERQALVLEGAAVLPNPAGCAPGQRFDLPDNQTLFVLPGPPHEFNAILDEEIIPWLKTRYAGARPKLVRIIKTKGIGESSIVTMLEDAEFDAGHIDLGFYPGMGKVEIRLTAHPDLATEVENAAATLRNLLAGHLDPEA
ncbi:MAG: competence/damage-inducible protein A [Pontiellaceae bacterium]|nr:competence/damage-inducible protein A [Pontiellaceae bacterium]MBN2784686.1 competence/damage-inducible protein A [Pontiellaceae bacterium]